MERTYRYLPFFFLGLLAILVWGFYRTYFELFPSFKGITTVQHIHGVLMLTWLAILIVQPILIRKKKLQWHRLIGKASYVVVPLLLVSIFLASKGSYYKLLSVAPPSAAFGIIALNIPSLFAFAAMYTLALVHKRYTPWHMRFMIGTSLLMIGPGLGRALIIYFHVPFPMGVSISDYVAIAIALTLLIVDLRLKKSYKPYTIILGIILLAHICWEIRDTPFWQAIGKWFATAFY